MNKKLVSLSHEAITKIIVKDHSDFFTMAAIAGKKIFHAENDVSWLLTAPFAAPNFIFGAQFSTENAQERIKYIVEKIKSGNAPELWVTSPVSTPENLGLLLEQNNFTLNKYQAAMALDLAELNEDFNDISGLTIKVVDNVDDLKSWCEVCSSELYKGIMLDMNMLETLMLEKNTVFFLACLDGIAVATSALFSSPTVAGIYWVSALSACRGKGIGKAITLAPLQFAREAGYNIATLQATQLGEKVYSKLGFKSYGRFDFYKYQGNSDND